jgi:hypothetical protein
MEKSNSLFKKILISFRKSDSHSVNFRWYILFLFLVIIWAFFALVLFPVLFSLWNENILLNLTRSEILEQMISWFFSPKVLFLIITVFLGISLAHIKVSDYFAAIQGKSNLFRSRFSLWIRVLGLPKYDIFKIDSSSIQDKRIQYLKEVGGPARIVVSAEHAAILEKSNCTVQIVGPTLNTPDKTYLLENFELLKEVVDLQNHTIRLNAQVRAKDGILFHIKNIRVIFCIYRNSQSGSLTRPFPFSAQGIYSLLYETPPESMQEKIEEMIKCEMIGFARHYKSSEILPHIDASILEKKNFPIIDKSIIKFQKRQKYEFLINNPKNTFNLKHSPKTKMPFRRNHKKIYPLYLDNKESFIESTNQNHLRQGDNSANISSLFQSGLSRKLKEKGIQLILFSLGAIEIEDNAVISNDNLSSQNEHSKKTMNDPNVIIKIRKASEKNEIQSFLNDIEDAVKSKSDRIKQNATLDKIRLMLQSNLDLKKGKLPSHDKQLEAALMNLDRLIKERDVNS